MKSIELQSSYKNMQENVVMSEKVRIFAQVLNSSNAPMRLRHIILSLLMALSIVPAEAQTSEGSSIASRTRLLSDGTRKVEQRVYDNGLGDVVEEILSYTGSSLPSVVVRHEYDDYSRRTRTWLPVTTSGSGYVSGSAVASLAQSQYNSDSAPFSRTEYDGFLPLQPSAQYKAGAQWQNNDRKVRVAYSEYVGAGMYSPADGLLYVTANTAKFLCTRTTDEDSCWTAEYTDLDGRLMISETSQGKTYYMYDAKGDVTHVIPPILSEYLISYYGYDSEFIPDNDAMMQKYAYIYRYDSQRRCIYKKLPGCEPVYYVYDRTGACILTQDGNQRQRGEWAYSIPDRFGRPCISGICHNSISYTAEPLHSTFVYAEYDGNTAATGGYAVQNLTLSQQTLYSAAYYDDHTFIGHHGVPSSLTASAVSGFPIDNTLGHGLQTGSATAIISNGSVTGYLYSAMYYDSRYNVSQVKATNHFGGTDMTCTSYSYTGKPLNVSIQHVTAGTGTAEVGYTYAYDDADRMSSRTLSVAHGQQAKTLTFGYEYDALGRLAGVARPSMISASLDVSYAYDLHGWLKSIATKDFTEELFYADGLGTPCYNGNISSVKWQDKALSSIRGYKFSYDDADRLTQSVYGVGDALTPGVLKYDEALGYDAHGNVTRVVRNGYTPNSGGLMDDLTLTYDGNRLTGVTETAADYDATGTFEYKRANGSQYMYDSNGSLVADMSRGIAYVTYDGNSNPSWIYFTNGNATKYVYSAAGEKLKVVHYTAWPNITRPFGVQPTGLNLSQVMYRDSTDYFLGGSLVVKNGAIDKILFDGGYAQVTSGGSTSSSFTFFYYNKDHLGNNREVTTMRAGVKQVTNYYPSGAPFVESSTSSNPDCQPYKYNGKELDRMHGLDTYDYGARQYYSILGRWDRIDRFAEKYYNVSPYAYCANNPVKYIDPDGNKIRIYKRDQKQVLNYINKLAQGTFAVDKNGYLFLAKSSNTKGFSKTYTESLVRAIDNNKNTINIYVDDYYIDERNKKQDISQKGEGTTKEYYDGKIVVVISGKSYNKLVDKDGNSISDKPEYILAHEIAGHAEPRLNKKKNGKVVNAVKIENIIRRETNEKERKDEPNHMQ